MVLRPDNFTEQAQEVLRESQEIVRRYRHPQWDAEHILMALLEQKEGVTLDLLAELGAPTDAIRASLHSVMDGVPRSAQHGDTDLHDSPSGGSVESREGRGRPSRRRLHQRGAPARLAHP